MAGSTDAAVSAFDRIGRTCGSTTRPPVARVPAWQSGPRSTPSESLATAQQAISASSTAGLYVARASTLIDQRQQQLRELKRIGMSRPGVSGDSQNWEASQHGTSEQVQRGAA
jgi:hypothetical protein